MPPGVAFQKQFRELHEACSRNMEESLDDERSMPLVGLHASAAVLADWAQTLQPRIEAALIASAEKEYQLSVLALLQGNHRHAFRGLRLAMELTLQSVHLSLNYLALREWIIGKQETIWSSIVDDKSGVFSERVVGVLWPEMSSSAALMCLDAREIYKKCSGYVHGNFSIGSTDRPVIATDFDAVAEWSDLGRRALSVMQFALMVRFAPDIARLPPRIHTALEDNFSYIEGFRLKFAQNHTAGE